MKSARKSRRTPGLLEVLFGLLIVGGIVSWVIHSKYPAPPQDQRPIDDETIASYEELGATFGEFGVLKGEGSGGKPRLVWQGGNTREMLPGFEFQTFPQKALPYVRVPFGLCLNRCQVTDADLRKLAHLNQLVHISLGQSNVSDANLKALNEIGRLHAADFVQSIDFDVGSKAPQSAADITWCKLDGTAVTDVGLKELKPFVNLVALFLQDTTITDAGLEELIAFQDLQFLRLNNTNVTDAGIARLQRALPNCKIERRRQG